MVTITIIQNNKTPSNNTSGGGSSNSGSGGGGSSGGGQSAADIEVEKRRKENEERTGTKNLSAGEEAAIRQKVAAEESYRARQNPQFAKNDPFVQESYRQELERISKKKGIPVDKLPSGYREAALVKATSEQKTLARRLNDTGRLDVSEKDGVRTIRSPRGTAVYSRQQVQQTQQQQQQNKVSYSGYTKFTDEQGKTYLPQSGRSADASILFGQEVSAEGKRAFVNAQKGSIVLTNESAPKQPSQGEQYRYVLGEINQNASTRGDYTGGYVTLAPQQTGFQKTLGKIETAVASTISRGESRSFGELGFGEKLSVAQKESPILGFLNPVRQKVESARLSLEPRGVEILPKEKLDLGTNYAKVGLSVVSEAVNEPVTFGLKLYGLSIVGKTLVGRSVLASTYGGFVVAETIMRPTATSRLNYLAGQAGSLTAYGSIIGGTQFTFEAFSKTPSTLPKMLSDKSGAVFRGGQRVSPKSKVQLSKETRNQYYNPNIFINQNEVGVRLRSPELKKGFTQTRTVRLDQGGIKSISDKPLGGGQSLVTNLRDNTNFQNQNTIRASKLYPQNYYGQRTGSIGNVETGPLVLQTKNILSTQNLQIKRIATGKPFTYVNKPQSSFGQPQLLVEQPTSASALQKTGQPIARKGFRPGQYEKLYGSIQSRIASQKQAQATQELLQLNYAAEQYLRQPVRIELVQEPVRQMPSITGMTVSQKPQLAIKQQVTPTVQSTQTKSIVIPLLLTGTQTRQQTAVKAETKTRQELSVLQSTRSDAVSIFPSLQKQQTLTQTQQDTRQKTLQKTDTIVFTGLDSLTKSRYGNGKTRQDSVERITLPTLPIARPTPDVPFNLKPRPRRIISPRKSETKKENKPFIPRFDQPKQYEQGFYALVKSRGKFVKVSGLVSKEKALETGAMEVTGFGREEYASAASFKIQAGGLITKGEKRSVGFFVGLQDMFRSPKKKAAYSGFNLGGAALTPDVYIEKNKYRINTPAEVRQISKKGGKKKKVKDIWDLLY